MNVSNRSKLGLFTKKTEPKIKKITASDEKKAIINNNLRLTEILAEKARNNLIYRTEKNKIIGLLNNIKDELAEAIKDDWTLKDILNTLQEQGKIGEVSYVYFARLVAEINLSPRKIRKPTNQNQIKTKVKKSKIIEELHKQRETQQAQSTYETHPQTTSTTTNRIRSFDYDPRPDPDHLI